MNFFRASPMERVPSSSLRGKCGKDTQLGVKRFFGVQEVSENPQSIEVSGQCSTSNRAPTKIAVPTFPVPTWRSVRARMALSLLLAPICSGTPLLFIHPFSNNRKDSCQAIQM